MEESILEHLSFTGLFIALKALCKSYPIYEPLGIKYYDAANPVHFSEDPAFGWGFYAHRIDLYRNTTPHQGFSLLQEWIERYRMEYFVVTSNVDGQFQKAGFPEDKIFEVHGSIHFLQCEYPPPNIPLPWWL
jgi:NAD-dependent SIR2 family protein deacetylase